MTEALCSCSNEQHVNLVSLLLGTYLGVLNYEMARRKNEGD